MNKPVRYSAKMAPGWFIGEEVAKLDEQFFHHFWDSNNSWHTTLRPAA